MERISLNWKNFHKMYFIVTAYWQHFRYNPFLPIVERELSRLLVTTSNYFLFFKICFMFMFPPTCGKYKITESYIKKIAKNH